MRPSRAPGWACLCLILAVLLGCEAPSEDSAPISETESGPWADAARRGATVRALGNEPFWNLEIHPDRLILVTDLGETRTEMPNEGVVADGPARTWRAAAEGHELTVVVEERPCTDTMSDEEFEATATVTFDGEILHGCARFLTPPR